MMLAGNLRAPLTYMRVLHAAPFLSCALRSALRLPRLCPPPLTNNHRTNIDIKSMRAAALIAFSPFKSAAIRPLT